MLEDVFLHANTFLLHSYFVVERRTGQTVEHTQITTDGSELAEGRAVDQVAWMGLPDERGRAEIFEHYLRGLKLAPSHTPDRLAAELASVTPGMTGADIAYLCQRAAKCCVKDAVGGRGEPNDIAIVRHHFDAALLRLTTAHSTAAASEPPRLLLAG